MHLSQDVEDNYVKVFFLSLAIPLLLSLLMYENYCRVKCDALTLSVRRGMDKECLLDKH